MSRITTTPSSISPRRIAAMFSALLVSLAMFSGSVFAHHSVPATQVLVAFAGNQINVPVTVRRVELSASPLLQARVQAALQREVQAIKTAFQQKHTVQVSRIRLHADKLELVGHRMVQTPVRVKSRPAGVLTRPVRVWLEEVTLTIPRQYLSSNWDVLSVQKELERLGIKIKPKPPVPRPTSQMSG